MTPARCAYAGCLRPPMVGELTCEGHRATRPAGRTLMQAIESYVEAQAVYAVASHEEARHDDEDFGRERKEVERTRRDLALALGALSGTVAP